jgi:hypothetical protein
VERSSEVHWSEPEIANGSETPPPPPLGKGQASRQADRDIERCLHALARARPGGVHRSRYLPQDPHLLRLICRAQAAALKAN